MEKKLFYFGCSGGQPGHGWVPSLRDHQIANDLKCNEQLIKVIDGTFTPRNYGESIYIYSVVDDVQIVSWVDYSVDRRPGSHSTLVGSGFDSAEDMIDAAFQKFPSEMRRQNRPVPKLKL